MCGSRTEVRAWPAQNFSNFNEFAKKVGERIGSFLDYFESCENIANTSLASPCIKKGHAGEAEVLAKMPEFGPNADWASRSPGHLLRLDAGVFARRPGRA